MFDPLESLSEDQARTLDHLADGKNVSLDADPGCGKSMLICQIAAAFPTKNMLVVSFNTSLVKETQSKMCMIKQRHEDEKSGWIVCSTYHGLLTSLTGEIIKDEVLFENSLRKTDFGSINWKFADVDILIVDEAQDMKPLYFEEIVRVAYEICSNPMQIQWCLFGNGEQLLYFYYPINKADERYMTLAPLIFDDKATCRQWVSEKLDTSYRLTPQMCNVVNAFLPICKLKSGKEPELDKWVRLHILDIYKDAAQVVYEIVKQRKKNFEYHDILIVCPFLRSAKSPAMNIVDLLVANGIHVHIERPGQKASRDVMQNKVHIRTRQNSKGLEYHNVIYLSMENLICLNPDALPRSKRLEKNPVLVGLTRAKTHLDILQSSRNINELELTQSMSCLTQRDLRVICRRPLAKQPKKAIDPSTTTKQTASKSSLHIHSLFAFLDNTHMMDLLKHIEFIQIVDGLDEKDETITEEEENEAEDLNGAYVRAVTRSFDENRTFVNLVAICNSTLKLALEFWWTCKVPGYITKEVWRKIERQNDPKFNIMRHLFHDAIDNIGTCMKTCLPLNLEQRKPHIWDIMSHLAKLALICESLVGYREHLHVITNFQFAQSVFLQRRFYALCDNVETLFCVNPEDDPSSNQELIWEHKETGRLLHQNECVQIEVEMGILNADKSIFVYFSSGLLTCYEDRLAAISAAIIINKSLWDNEVRTVYVMNLADTSVEKVDLQTDGTLQTIPSSFSDAFARSTVCDFLDKAIQCKVLNSHQDSEDDEDDQDPETGCLVGGRKHSTDNNQEFIQRAQTTLAKSLKRRRDKDDEK